MPHPNEVCRFGRDTHDPGERFRGYTQGMNRAVDDLQIELMRKATPERKLELTFSFSAGLVALAREALKTSHPGLSDDERDLLFVERNYGADLAARLRADLSKVAGAAGPVRPGLPTR